MSGPTLELECELWMEGYLRVAGLDEAGRGAWAGPVVAAAVVLPPNRGDLKQVLGGVDDSKQLTAKQREALFPLICGTALAVGVGTASARFIDTAGIVPATRRAMSIALRDLGLCPDWLLIDALGLPRAQQAQRSVIRGDALVLSIAAASIVAKVSRDRLMVALDARLPGYGFATHKGYGTRAHRAALERLGPCQAHRMSFAPLRNLHNCPA